MTYFMTPADVRAYITGMVGDGETPEMIEEMAAHLWAKAWDRPNAGVTAFTSDDLPEDLAALAMTLGLV